MHPALKAEINRALALFEPYLTNITIWREWPPRLAEAARYALFGGGKRVRPCLALLSAEAMGGDFESALPWAAAVEMIHTYSLIHDDLPSMDDDDVRRGRPTVHRQFDEATAILAGDALLTEAFAVISRSAPDPRYAQNWGRLLAEASGGRGMVGGQVDDIKGVEGLSDLIAMQRKKTGALISASVLGGGVIADVSPEWMAKLECFGDALGMLFQITDDLIDAEQDATRDANSFLHHLSLDEVIKERDKWANIARQSVEGANSSLALLYFVDYICHRQT
jgi:geranylgeranyl diphosphate synthase, type II